ncbi:MAG: toll/interleukin-1 receptor domain-containing protein [Anaerolineae bacterium]|nr:toll/interleukin-1 receptor domain-containing protein [Anaerolineae bacterium]
MPPVYISYRSNDAAVVQRIVTRCLQTYGPYSVILHPEDSQPDNTRLEIHIDNLIHTASTVLLVIGKDWAGLDEFGRFKLSTADVPIQPEVKASLRSDKQVLVVLVNGVKMPAPELVPEDLHGIFSLPIVELRDESFRADLNQLIHPPTLVGHLRYFFSLEWLNAHTRSHSANP